MTPTLDTKWNDYPYDTLYLFDGTTIFAISEGDGNNLDEDDRALGYQDYWITEYYDFNTEDGGQWMETDLIENIDYTIQGVIDRIKECDLWNSDWKIIDHNTGEKLMFAFDNYYNWKTKARLSKESIIDKINSLKENNNRWKGN